LPAIYKGDEGETTVVDRVMLARDTKDRMVIKCVIRHTRRPEVWLGCIHLISSAKG
jgi:DNA-directed RNA polymerase III subunit RPC2